MINMHTMNRREFLKRTSAALTWLALPHLPELEE
jgi:hypothetical protein